MTLSLVHVQFNAERSKDDGSIFLTLEQAKYLKSLSILAARGAQRAPARPENARTGLRRHIFKLVVSSEMANLVNGTIRSLPSGSEAASPRML